MVEESTQTLTLGKQLASGAGMMLVMTLTHALGLTGISSALNLHAERLKELDFDWRSIWLMSAMGVLLIILHIIEIGLFAGFYLLVGALEVLEEALYYSASAYTTLGRSADFFPEDWRLMSGLEALIGFLLIGWSTAFIVSKVNRMMPD